ncbi:MAG: hypothetical protein WB780_20365 [Candidatus Acidiferrales bacterium]
MAKRATFRHEDVEAVPRGWRVRTIAHGEHRVRVAFPAGRRQKGGGKLISILHPNKENPSSRCAAHIQKNYTEEVKDGKGNRWITSVTHSGKDWMAEGYPVVGKKIKRVGAPVIARGPSESEAADRLWMKIEPNPNYDRSNLTSAISAASKLSKGTGGVVYVYATAGGFVVTRTPPPPSQRHYIVEKAVVRLKNGSNPDKSTFWMTAQEAEDYLRQRELPKKSKRKAAASRRTPKRNLDEIGRAQKLYEEFSGKASGKVTMINEPVKARDDYAHLGWVEWVAFHLAYDDEGYDPPELSSDYHEMMEEGTDVDDAWEEIADSHEIKLRVLDFSGDEIRLAASPQGNQLYFLGGNQKAFEEHLGSFHTDTSRDRVLLGEVVALSYEAKKEQLGDKKPISYYHVFAEESGEPPVAYWDALTKRIMLVGGNYSLDNAKVGIVN